MGRFRDSMMARTLAALCALALVLVSFAHRPVDAGTGAVTPELAAWVAVGGSLDDLCLGGADPGHAGGGKCPACLLAKALAMAPAAMALPVPADAHGIRRHWPDAPAVASHAPHAPAARGPPLRLI